MRALSVDIDRCRYQALVGVGGIGSGMFFALNGNHTLGREESRSGRLIDRRDYCKLHIVSHYVQTLLGPEFTTIPVGKVGDDDLGGRVSREMFEAGLDMRYVAHSPGDQTLFSLCFVYPDGSGGNLTIDDSACARVDAPFVAEAKAEFGRFEGRGIALALPEVPMEARAKLLELGTEHRFFRVASFTSAEMSEVVDSGILRLVDLLAVNLDEAAAGAGFFPAAGEPQPIVEAAVRAMTRVNPQMLSCVTAGSKGSWSWDGQCLVHVPAFQAEVVSTAGAGDAYLSGTIVGVTAGLQLSQAQELGALVASLSVTSPHTINKEIDRESLRAFATRSQAPICDAVRRLLEG
jgi:ribokinase